MRRALARCVSASRLCTGERSRKSPGAGHGSTSTHLAHDGISAVPAARATRPDVILMDIGLPGKDGYELVKELRAFPETAAACIVATTGYGRDEDRARCLAAGFDAHLTKPISQAAFAEVLARGRAGERPDKLARPAAADA